MGNTFRVVKQLNFEEWHHTAPEGTKTREKRERNCWMCVQQCTTKGAGNVTSGLRLCTEVHLKEWNFFLFTTFLLFLDHPHNELEFVWTQISSFILVRFSNLCRCWWTPKERFQQICCWQLNENFQTQLSCAKLVFNINKSLLNLLKPAATA